MSNSNVKSDYLRGLKDGVPIGLGYIPLAIACGIATSKAGIPFLLSQLMEILIYSGSGLTAAITLFKGGETVVIMYALAILVANCRYMIFSMSLAQRLDPSMNLIERILVGALNTDEVFGVVIKEKGYIKFKYFLGVATMPFVCFALGNALGSFTTDLLPDFISSALGIIIYAMFIALIVPSAKESKPIFVVVAIALIISIIFECIPAVTQFLSAGWIVILCAIITSAIGALLFPVEEKEEV